MASVIFSPDIHRNYCNNDIINYHNILKDLSKDCPCSYNILETIKHPLNSHDSWKKLQKSDSNVDDIFKHKNILYVFFEIPEYLSNFFKLNQIPYINFMTSKIRFPGMEPSIMFESNLNIKDKLDLYTKYPAYKPTILKEYVGKRLAIGQMYADRSVIFEGEARNLFDYNFDADIFRPHPLALQHQKEYSKIIEHKAKTRNIKISTIGSIYDILYSADSFVGLSSSTLYEAEYIGKPVTFLQEKEYIRLGSILKWSDINKKFWSIVLNQL